MYLLTVSVECASQAREAGIAGNYVFARASLYALFQNVKTKAKKETKTVAAAPPPSKPTPLKEPEIVEVCVNACMHVCVRDGMLLFIS